MILVDANLLVYAVDRDSPYNQAAHAWVEKILSSATPVGLAWLVVLAFLRITTRGVLRRSLSPERAIAYIELWLSLPNVSLVSPGERHWRILRNLVEVSGTAGNLTSDAHLAALAIEHGYTLYSSDHDFRRFAGLKVVNPLES